MSTMSMEKDEEHLIMIWGHLYRSKKSDLDVGKASPGAGDKYGNQPTGLSSSMTNEGRLKR